MGMNSATTFFVVVTPETFFSQTCACCLACCARLMSAVLAESHQVTQHVQNRVLSHIR